MNFINVYILDVRGIMGDLNRFLPYLPKSRIEKANRFLKDEDKALSIGAGLLVEEYVGEGEYAIDKNGKPSKGLDKKEFSLSHTWPYAVIAISENPVGVDIEVIKEVKKGLAEHAFTEQEQSLVKTTDDFYLCWSAKEAASKCVGTGLLAPRIDGLNQIDGDLYEYKGVRLYVQRRLLDGYSFAIASSKPFDYEIKRVGIEDFKLLK